MQNALFLMFFLLLTHQVASADIYKYVDENGIVCYTDAPFGKKPQPVIREKETRSIERSQPSAPVTFPKDYSHFIHKAASKYDLEPELIRAVIKTESNGNHRAVSRKGAMGLMQLMPSTANDMNVSNPFNPEENIDGGSKYLKYLLERFNGNVTLALAAYNSGPKTVEKYGNVPPINETRQYVKRIFNLYGGKKSYAIADAGHVSNVSSAPKETRSPIYRVVLEDGTILFTNSTLEKGNKTRL